MIQSDTKPETFVGRSIPLRSSEYKPLEQYLRGSKEDLQRLTGNHNIILGLISSQKLSRAEVKSFAKADVLALISYNKTDFRVPGLENDDTKGDRIRTLPREVHEHLVKYFEKLDEWGHLNHDQIRVLISNGVFSEKLLLSLETKAKESFQKTTPFPAFPPEKLYYEKKRLLQELGTTQNERLIAIREQAEMRGQLGAAKEIIYAFLLIRGIDTIIQKSTEFQNKINQLLTHKIFHLNELPLVIQKILKRPISLNDLLEHPDAAIVRPRP